MFNKSIIMGNLARDPLYIKADNVQFLGGKKEAATASTGGADEEIPF